MNTSQSILLFALIIGSTCFYSATAFVLPLTTPSNIMILTQQHHHERLFSQNNQNQPPNNDESSSSLLERFTKPVIDDPWLPLTEAGLAQVVAPSLQLFWLAALQSPFPSWANPLFSSGILWNQLPRGSFLAPTLIHGAGLACCWILGALASKGYERKAFAGDAGTVLLQTAKAGAFSVGLLILATQWDLYTELGGYVQVGDSVETDIRIYRALVEGINDCFFEGIVLLGWRFYRSAAANYPLP
ncbi:unnamed protein product [Cylindrotheca closterium]|uniref:Uncharacterized protein n=1 Tax=Cylindrotheca closterium TaxID=2856 RepID=A0AAD2FT06_9STRA|nr:unnamed protein product [Cylindrotheca closterium]